MARATLSVSPRTEVGKGASHRLRAEGHIPAVVYGRGREPLAVTADPKDVVALLNGEFGRNTPVDLAIGDGAPRLAIIKDYQVHPFKRRLTHVDFWEVTPDQKIVMTVPFKRVGRAEAERTGGKIRLTRDDVKITCTADNVPAAVEFDFSKLPAADANITISKIPMPEGVEAVYKHDYSLVQIKMPRISAADAAEADAKGKKAKGKK